MRLERSPTFSLVLLRFVSMVVVLLMTLLLMMTTIVRRLLLIRLRRLLLRQSLQACQTLLRNESQKIKNH
jgi:hypothetical protein